MKTVLMSITTIMLLCICNHNVLHAHEMIPEYKLSISIDPEKSLITGRAEITIENDGDVPFAVSMGKLNVQSIMLNGVSVGHEIKDSVFKSNQKGIIKIVYEGVFPQLSQGKSNKKPGAGYGTVVSLDGVFLNNGWYPLIQGPAHFSLTATVPEGFIAVSEADTIIENKTQNGNEFVFLFPHPLYGITLAADRYVVVKDSLGDTEIFAYFIEKDLELADTYLSYAKQYIEMYSKLVGVFPFRRFSVVENVLATGYSMPTYTLLGRDVVRLPFIVKASLGHEVLHQWFGNSVYTDYEKGNWSEGLVTYLSNHMFAEKEQKGWLYRKNALIDYHSHVNSENDTTLKDFIQRTDFASKAVGYGKGSMLFHMLRTTVGQEAFSSALKELYTEKKFQSTSWEDIQAIFENVSGKDLEIFFQQMLMRKDIPNISVRDPKVIYKEGIPNASFTIKQKTAENKKPFIFDLNVNIATKKGDLTKLLHITKEKESFEIQTKDTPLSLSIDPDYDLMRSLLPEEYPPVLSRVFGDKDRLMIVGPESKDIYLGLIEELETRGFSEKSEDEISDSEISKSTLVLFGKDSKVHERLFGKNAGDDFLKAKDNNSEDPDKPGFTLTVKKHPLNPAKVVLVAQAESKNEVDFAARKLSHYGKYSKIGFLRGRNLIKDTTPTSRGIYVNLEHHVKGIRTAGAMSIDEIVEDIINKPVIYVGESHTSYEDHRVQLEVIRGLHARGCKFAIGMEMFQSRFQKGIDDYLSGSTNEKEFLKATGYFKEWRFNYHLYREIIDFARANSIPVLALNVDSKITRQVARGGLDALSKEDRELVPTDMDMSDGNYINRLKNIFRQGQHSGIGFGNFYNFYQSQIIWDESMAHKIAEFFAESPDHQMVALAGSGHIMYGQGIPQRVKRLTGKEYALLINSQEFYPIDDKIADYVLFPSRLNPPVSPKLGVIIKDGEGMAQIKDFSSKSVALLAGLKKRDIIKNIDDLKIESIEDIKISLFDKKSGDNLKVEVERKKVFLGKKKMAFIVTLQ